MLPKKILFPVGGGDELEARIHGALLVAQKLNSHLEVLVSESTTHGTVPSGVALPSELVKKLESIHVDNMKSIMDEHRKIFDHSCEELGITESMTPLSDASTAHVNMVAGVRSTLVAQQSKFCDMVIAAAPQKGVATATFEAAVLESGKPVMVIPRVLEEFKADEIIVGWNNSPEVARAVSEAIPFMKKAKRVHIVSSKAYTTDNLTRIGDLRTYLAFHGIETTFELIKTTFVPGEAILKAAKDGGFNLIVAGAYCKKGLKEMMLGGSSRYLLEHTDIPALVSH